MNEPGDASIRDCYFGRYETSFDVSRYLVFNDRWHRARHQQMWCRVRGADRDRTDDLRLAKPALSQLSYSPVGSSLTRLCVGQGRLELPTSRLSGVRSNHLSYWPGQATAFCGCLAFWPVVSAW